MAYGSLDICLLTVTELPIVYQELAKHGIAVEVGIVERNGALGKCRAFMCVTLITIWSKSADMNENG